MAAWEPHDVTSIMGAWFFEIKAGLFYAEIWGKRSITCFYISNLSADQGMDWPLGTCPVSKYEFSSDQSPYHPVQDGGDAILELLKWIYHSNVLKTVGPEIVLRESLKFIVKNDTAGFVDQQWKAAVTVFDVDDQEEKTFYFRLIEGDQ